MISDELLDILVCPLCKTDLDQQEDTLHCTREECGCVFEIDEEIPIMLIEEADRSCPECGTQRDWIPENNKLSCPDCGASFQYDAGEAANV